MSDTSKSLPGDRGRLEAPLARGEHRFSDVFLSLKEISAITGVWIVAVATCGMLMATSEKSHLPWNVMIVVASIWLGGSAFVLLRAGHVGQLDRLAPGQLALDRLALPAFIRINVYVLLIMAALVGSALW